MIAGSGWGEGKPPGFSCDEEQTGCEGTVAKVLLGLVGKSF